MKYKEYVVIHGIRYYVSIVVKNHIERLQKEIKKLKEIVNE